MAHFFGKINVDTRGRSPLKLYSQGIALSSPKPPTLHQVPEVLSHLHLHRRFEALASLT